MEPVGPLDCPVLAHLDFRGWGWMCEVWSSGFGAWGLGIGVWGWGFGVWSVGFRVYGAGVEIEG